MFLMTKILNRIWLVVLSVMMLMVVCSGTSLAASKVAKPAVTEKIVSSQTTTEIKLKWRKVAGATGYRIYQYNPSTEKWEKIKTTTSKSHTVSNLAAGTKYKFKVKAYKKVDDKTLWGKASATFTTATKPTVTEKIVSSQTTSEITLKWRKVTGATGYRIYQYNPSTEKWEKLETTTSKSYTVKNLDSGTKYKFKVKAYKTVGDKNFWGKASATFTTATKPAVTEKIVSSQTTSEITLKWKKVTGATGYRIYQYNPDTEKWEKIETTTSKSYTVKNLDSGTKYKFKVKAYKTVGDKTIWGKASETFAVKTDKVVAVFDKPIGVYESKNLPSTHFLYDEDCAAWISVYTVGKNEKNESEIKAEFKKAFGYDPQEKVKCTYVGEYNVKGYSGAQQIYQYSIEDYTYPLILFDFYELSWTITDDGCPWVGFCVPMEDYYESEEAQKLLDKINSYFYETSGYSEEYVKAHPDNFDQNYCLIWSGPYRTKDGKIIDQITWIFKRGSKVAFNKDVICDECGEFVPAGEVHRVNNCKAYCDPVFRQQYREELLK